MYRIIYTRRGVKLSLPQKLLRIRDLHVVAAVRTKEMRFYIFIRSRTLAATAVRRHVVGEERQK